MSWSFHKTDAVADVLREELEDARDDYKTTSGLTFTDEVDEQIEAAIDCAIELRATVGGEKVNVNLSGHANPGHKPTDAYANDCVTVSVTNADPKPEPADSESDAGAE